MDDILLVNRRQIQDVVDGYYVPGWELKSRTRCGDVILVNQLGEEWETTQRELFGDESSRIALRRH